MKKGIIFDLDGTLINSLPDIAGSMNRVLVRNGLEVHPVEAYKLMVGNGAVRLTERAIGGQTDMKEKVYREYRAEYSTHACVDSYPYEGMTKTLQALEQRGIMMAVFSNKDQEDTEQVIRHYFPGIAFSIVRGRQEGVPLKPSPEGALMIAEAFHLKPEEVLYVGDTGTDMDCGKNASMETVGVSWGFRSVDELKEHQACHIIDKPEELLAYFDQ